MADTIGTAYVQIEPSFEGVTSKIDSHFSGEGEKGGKSFAAGFGSVIGTVGKVAAGAAAAGTAAVASMAKQAVFAYADYEQLVGGVETLFGTASDYVTESAADAFKTAGLSANEYMETVTSFSASLIQSVGGDTYKAAQLADQAIIDMSDNANKMGSSMESIQNAYQGFAKQNYTMLDNLKLGYGGTKEEMARLLADAEKISGVKYDLSSYADIVSAIHVVQENMGIAGTTAKEAADTISGSLGMVKGAWQNVIAAIGEGNEDKLGAYIADLANSVETAASNLLPVVQKSLSGISQLIQELAPKIAKMLPDLIREVLPGLLSAGVEIIDTLAKGILDAIPDLMPTITDVIMELCDMLVEMLPQLIEVGLQVILQLALGIAQALPELIPAIVDTVLTIAEYLIDNVDLLIDAAIALILGLAEGLINALPKLIEKAPEIVIKLVEAIIRNAPKLIQASLELILMLVKGFVDSWAKMFEVGKQLVDKVKDGFSQKLQDAKNWGKDMIQNFIDGIMAKWNDLKASVSKVASTVKSFLGFSEPEEGPLSNFHTYAPDMMDLFAEGIMDNIGVVENAMSAAAAGVLGSGVDFNAIQSVSGSVDLQDGTDGIMGRIEALLQEYLPNIGNDIYLDTGELVGGTVAAYDAALGARQSRGYQR